MSANGKKLEDAGGKKIFLLYPHSVIQEKMLDTLIMNGFETYTLRDYKKAFKILEQFPSSIMFVNIEDGLPEKDWETYIRGIQKHPKTKDTRIGILSYNQDKGLMEKYLLEIGIPCGYVQLKLGLMDSTNIIMTALEANEARGRRKHIRAFCEEGISATLNFRNESGLYQGKILDISSTGIAAKVPNLPEMSPNAVLHNVQLKLHGALVMTDVIVAGKRQGDRDVYIMLFDPAKLDEDGKLTIHHFIKDNLQRFIDQLKL
jgi:hypothetical protein